MYEAVLYSGDSNSDPVFILKEIHQKLLDEQNQKPEPAAASLKPNKGNANKNVTANSTSVATVAEVGDMNPV